MVSLLQRLTFPNAGVPAQRKVGKRLCPGVRHLAEARCSLATVSIRGHHLRSAEGAKDQKQKRGGLPAGLMDRIYMSPLGFGRLAGRHRQQAGSHRDWVQPQETWRLSGRLRWQASSHRDWGQPQETWRLSGRLCWQASFHRDWGQPQKTGRLAGRHRQQAGSHRGRGYPSEFGRLAGRLREQARSHNGSAYTPRFSPLNRPSVSSPAAFDLDPPAPSGG